MSKTEDFVIPPEGIPVEPGTKAHRMWRLCLETPLAAPSRKSVKRTLRGGGNGNGPPQ